MPVSDAELLDDLLLEWEDRLDSGRPATPEELCPPERSDLLERLKAEVAKLERMRGLEESPTPDDHSGQDSTLPPEAARFEGGRFRPSRFLARGGLGAVYVARDRELGRRVALKTMRADRSTEAARLRFEREAAITGRLEHPGVVPVYGRGVDNRGQPYYAMRFIAGENLRQAVETYRSSAEVRPAGERARTMHGLVTRFAAACQTIAYAHSRGVIHRDLKPDNIMLGPYGETLVVDWGLARLMAGATADESAAADETPADESLTRSGAALGTPAYMSPEQASGNTSAVGTASDIFGLGATLYFVLTGRGPYRGATALEDAIAGRFPRPSAISPGVPKALEAVALKAMARDPSDRYPNAAALAADLESWLAGERVTAWREPWLTRLGRSIRRHRSLAAAVAAAVLVAAVASGAGVVVLGRKNGELAQANRDVSSQRDEAQAAQRAETMAKAEATRNAAEATNRANALYTTLSGVVEQIAPPPSTGKRTDLEALLNDIEAKIDQLEGLGLPEHDVAKLRALACYAHGSLLNTLRPDDAAKYYERAWKALKPLEPVDPQTFRARTVLYLCTLALNRLERRDFNTMEQTLFRLEACDIAWEDDHRTPEDAEFLRAWVAMCRGKRALVQKPKVGNEDLEHLENAARLGRELYRGNALNTHYFAFLFVSTINLVDAHTGREELGQAIESIDEAMRVLESSSNWERAQGLAAELAQRRGNIYTRDFRLDKSIVSYLDSAAKFYTAGNQEPGNAQWKISFTQSLALAAYNCWKFGHAGARIIADVAQQSLNAAIGSQPNNTDALNVTRIIVRNVNALEYLSDRNYTKSRGIYQNLLKDVERIDWPVDRKNTSLGTMHFLSAMVESFAEDSAMEEFHFRKCLEHFEKVNPLVMDLQARNLRAAAERTLEARKGGHAASAKAAQKIENLSKTDSDIIYHAARLFADARNKLLGKRTAAELAAEELRTFEEYTEGMNRCLDKVVSLGFRNRKYFMATPEFQPIKDSSDFRARLDRNDPGQEIEKALEEFQKANSNR
jgi:tRNA A-37 threonylcarbamoyl transferase component Bud32